MKALFFFVFIIGVVLILFINDYDKLQERAVEMKLEEVDAIEKKLKNCKEKKKNCNVYRKKIDNIENRKPFVTSLLLIWLTENFDVFINNLGIQNIIILILVLFALKLIIFS